MMEAGSGQPGVQPIVRALDILRALNGRSFATLHALWEDTGLPKAIIHRILAVLCEQGYVARNPIRSVYRLTSQAQLLSARYSERSRISNVGAGILRAVTRETRWPLALGTLERTEVVVRYSTMPFSFWAVLATRVNKRHRLLDTTIGSRPRSHRQSGHRQVYVLSPVGCDAGTTSTGVAVRTCRA
jgi:IclR family mhp operon transcriptional activator